KKADVDGRVALIKKQIDEASSDYDKEKLQERLAKLGGGVAQINAGAATEVEMKERQARIQDALNAARAAVEEGVVPGGGVALARAAAALDKLKAEGDEKVGINILREALDKPLRQIAENAGHNGSVVAHKVLESDSPTFGFNAMTEKYEDLVKAGVIDPLMVIREALQNAASVATILLTTEAIITEKPVKEEAPPMPPGGMPGGMPGMGGGMPGMGMPGMGGM
ncbi:MAG: TCP-1/cpn60 chaperonin family protein, partial [Planctomycetota bacterium]